MFGPIFMGVSHALEIAIYVLKSANGGLLCRPLYLSTFENQVCNLTNQKSLFLIFGLLLCYYLITKIRNSKISTTFMFSKGPAHCRKIGLSLAAQNTKPCAFASSIAKATLSRFSSLNISYTSSTRT